MSMRSGKSSNRIFASDDTYYYSVQASNTSAFDLNCDSLHFVILFDGLDAQQFCDR